MRALAVVLVLFSGIGWIFTNSAVAQDSTSPQSSAVCTFEDGKEISIRYNPVFKGSEIPRGKVWPESPSIFLFSATELTLGGSTIPAGAYSVFVIPGKDKWTVIVNKNVTPGSKYDEKDNLARGTMETGEVGQPTKEIHIAFAHMAAKKCTMNFYYGKAGAFGDFLQK